MNAPTEDIKDYLIRSDSGVTVTFGVDLFIGFLPENNILCSVLLDTPGGPPNPNDIENPSIQIITRGLQGGYKNAFAEIYSIAAEIHALANETINSTNYIQVWKMGEIAHIGNDSKGRPMFSCTFAIQRS